MSEVGSMACVGFMVEGTFACVLVGEGEFFFLLMDRAVRGNVFWGICGLSIC